MDTAKTDASGNVTVSAAALQRIYDRISQIEKDAQVVADEYCRLLRLRAAGESPPFSSLTPLSQAAFRIADTSTQAVVAMETALPFVLERNAQKHVAATVAVKPEEEDLYA
jgi:hypothetical protein